MQADYRTRLDLYKRSEKSQLLIAMGINTDNLCYPTTYAVVEKECYMTCLWFLEMLKVDYDLENSNFVTFMTRKQKGLELAIKTLCDEEEPKQRICVRHIYANFQLKFKRELLRAKLWKAVTAPSTTEFNDTMEEIRELNKDAHQWLLKNPKSQ